MAVLADGKVVLGGKSFAMRPCTYDAYERVRTEEPAHNEALQRGEIDRFDYYLRVLQLVLAGPTETLSKGDFCAREAEEVIEGFFPVSLRLQARLTGL